MTESKSGAFRVPQQRGADKHAASKNDNAHGYSQDSGYQNSGGYAQAKEQPLSFETKTQKPGNGHTHSDELIRSQLQKSLMKERAPRARHLLVSVGQGIVTLRGEVDDELERKRLTDLVRAVGEVRELHDELSTRATRNEIN